MMTAVPCLAGSASLGAPYHFHRPARYNLKLRHIDNYHVAGLQIGLDGHVLEIVEQHFDGNLLGFARLRPLYTYWPSRSGNERVVRHDSGIGNVAKLHRDD